ncbi:hypothetical protein CSA56_12555 [candidate division KSB3 bacterium]|uniref:Glycosyltransferase RgtA/B/C/D-like domain-containing protein n=1 Tax=candidate division KSB3 bacterium TaxID=2044937 RepID=A0A2G6KBZ1_9BACT|nr:MAG: hypothetical protein CSA56_12555 [candidate division KSB3 bacterium]
MPTRRMTTKIHLSNHIRRLSFFSKSTLYIALLCLVALLLSTKGIRDEGTISLQGDMPRYLMNGVYFFDFFKDLPLTHPLDYTYQYFARYPALSLGHHPPLISLATVPCYAMFGVSVSSARLATLGFFLLAGTVWFLLIKSLYNEEMALLSSLLFLTTPFVVKFSRVVMSEIPGLATTILMAYFVHRYCQSKKLSHLFAFGVVFIFAVLARYQAVLMVPIFVVYLLIVSPPRVRLTKKTFVIGGLLLLLCIPLVFIMLTYSKSNIEWLFRKSLASRLALSNLLFHIKALWKIQLSLPVLLLAIMSIVLSLITREKKTLLFLLWIGGYYLEITWLGAKEARYSIYWIPAFCFFAAILVDVIRHRSWKGAGSAFLILLIGYQFAVAYQAEPDYADGYETAAHYVLEHPKGDSTLFSANVDSGYFVFFTRKHEQENRSIILRADKLLVTSFLKWISEERISDREEIYTLLRDCGVGYVVLEDAAYQSPPLEWLREEVKSENFILRKRIPIVSKGRRLQGVDLAIYEFLGSAPANHDTELDMHIPLMGNSITVRLGDLLE